MRQPQPWSGRSVLITGHTGFKGGWLTLWLAQLGARVHGYALDPPTEPSLFRAARLPGLLSTDTRADLGELAALHAVLDRAEPEVVFHLAAQSLVREGYRQPLATFATNTMGTAHVLEAVRSAPSVRAVVVVTTDKVYDNTETTRAYAESDPLGGRDPYSASKAAAELVVASYRASYFGSDSKVRLATARAGNVLGGGDWAHERLLPDALRCFAEGRSLGLRYPTAVRPWQHVLEPVSGYLRLAELLLGEDAGRFERSFNFGPDPSGIASVGDIAAEAARIWGSGASVTFQQDTAQPHESGMLLLDSSDAHGLLGWSSRWSISEALSATIAWHKDWLAGADMRARSLDQIAEFERGGLG